MLLDRFKRKSQRLSAPKTSSGQDKKNAKRPASVKEQPARKPREKQKEAQEAPVADIKTGDKKRKGVVAPLVLRAPRITEKAVILQDKNQYVFKVAGSASKSEAKKAVEEVYNVDVLKVRMISIPAKKKRLGRTSGWQSGYKKAVVTVKKGQDIEIMPR
ncbi:MAG: 50S ribosomal protein L23 [Candidatus Pacebacteria bacterium]|nr:50S ribosomal protein L23 [Candidatus Paceibacterota bacterium]